jgi:hypothetical protein
MEANKMGLLDDAMQNPWLNLGVGLLAASGPSNRPVGLGHALMGGMSQLNIMQELARRKKEAEARQAAQELQAEESQIKMDQLRQQVAQQKALEAWGQKLVTGGFNRNVNIPAASPETEDEGIGVFNQRLSGMVPDQSAAMQELLLLNPGMVVKNYVEKMFKTDEPFTLKPGEKRFIGNQVVAEGGADVEKQPEFVRLLTAWQTMPEGPQKQLLGSRLQTMASHAPATKVQVNTDNLGLKPKDRFEMEGKLRDDYTKAAEFDSKILQATSKMKQVLTGNPNAMKDQAAIYSFAKVLDPDGAVRESDYAAIMNTAGMQDKIKNYLNKIKTGQSLSETQRSEMLGIMTAWENMATAKIGDTQKSFGGRASQYNLEPSNVFSPVQPSKPGKPGLTIVGVRPAGG